MVIVATEEVVEEEPVIEEPEEATREAAALEEPAPAVSGAPAASSGGGGIFGSVAQVLHRVLHPSAGHARNGSGEPHSPSFIVPHAHVQIASVPVSSTPGWDEGGFMISSRLQTQSTVRCSL